MEKKIELSMLLDLYKGLLTDKQAETMELYYNEDLSLSEIAENMGITRQGVRDALVKAEAALLSAISSIEMGISPDTCFIDIEDAISALGEIVGLTVSEEVVDRIFHSFCVGK